MRSEEIWDALYSDEALSALPDRLARDADARSAMMLYASDDGGTQMLAFNHWRPEDMARYVQSYARIDPWREAASRPDRINRVQLLSNFVSPQRFERSVVYNDFVRDVGDDTFWCLGACLSTPRGVGAVAVQRGRGSPDFDLADGAALQDGLRQLHQMFMVRGARPAMTERALTAEQALERMAIGALLVTAAGRVVVANPEAERILALGSWLSAVGGLRATGAGRDRFEALIARATLNAEMSGGSMVLRSDFGELLQVDVSPARDAARPGCAVVTLRCVRPPVGLEEALKTSFGLTQAEAAVAVRLAHGASAAAIAENRGVSVETVRMQTRAVLHKTGLAKTSALAALIGQLSVLGGRSQRH